MHSWSPSSFNPLLTSTCVDHPSSPSLSSALALPHALAGLPAPRRRSPRPRWRRLAGGRLLLNDALQGHACGCEYRERTQAGTRSCAACRYSTLAPFLFKHGVFFTAIPLLFLEVLCARRLRNQFHSRSLFISGVSRAALRSLRRITSSCPPSPRAFRCWRRVLTSTRVCLAIIARTLQRLRPDRAHPCHIFIRI
jgi:hypothetical protein